MMNTSCRMESNTAPDLQQTSRSRTHFLSESAGIQQSSAALNGCQMMGQNFSAAPQGPHMDPGNSNGDISLEGESFLQSLESIPMPMVPQQSTEVVVSYAPSVPVQNRYRSQTVRGSAAMQREILNAWGASGPPTNGTAYLHMQFPYSAGRARSGVPHRTPRGRRGRGRGRGLGRKTLHNNPSPPSHIPYGPRFVPNGRNAGERVSTLASTPSHFAPRSLNQIPRQMVSPDGNNNLMLPSMALLKQDLFPDSFQACDDSLMNEKMDAYIEKFSSDSSRDVVEPLLSVDSSHKPGTLPDAIGMYIDYLILENEKKTHISSCNIAQVPLDFHKEDYYQQVMAQPVVFPTPKFREWLKHYNVDIEITDLDGQTVTQTTFPPAEDDGDNHFDASDPTSWGPDGGAGEGSTVSPGLSYDVESTMRRFQHRGRVNIGHLQVPIYTSVVSDDSYTMGCNQNDPTADANFQRANLNVPHPQFKTISIPSLGAMQYLNQAPTGNMRPPHSTFSRAPLQANRRLQGPQIINSNYYRMAAALNSTGVPYGNEINWKGAQSNPGAMIPDAKSANQDETRGFSETVSTQDREYETLANPERNFVIPSVSNVLSSYPRYPDDQSGPDNPQAVTLHRFAPAPAVDDTLRTGASNAGLNCETWARPVFVNGSQELYLGSAGHPVLMKALKTESALPTEDGTDVESHYPASEPHDNELTWDVASNDRSGVAPALREMVDQGIQTENDEIVVTQATVCSSSVMRIKREHQDGESDQNLPRFLYPNVHDYCGKGEEDQMNSDILLRNATLILNGTLEMEDGTGFVLQETLSNSQMSNFEFDALVPLETSGGVLVGDVDASGNSGAPDDLISACRDSAGNLEHLNRSSELVLEVASNVEINCEESQRAIEYSENESEWSGIPCKRAWSDSTAESLNLLECSSQTDM